MLLAAATVLAGCQPGDPEPGPTGSPSASTSTAGPEPKAIKVLHWNVAGAREDRNFGQFGVIDKLAEQVRSERPDVISLNELCGNQNEHLTDRIKDLGYVGNFAANNWNFACGAIPGRSNMGVAVYVAGGAAPGSGNDYPAGQSTACLTSAGATPIRACSTHLTSPNKEHPEPVVRPEVYEVSRVLDPFRHLPVVVAGDFNLPSTNVGMRSLYERYYETDQAGPACGASTGHCTFPDSGPAKKLDYLFVDKEHFLERTEARISAPGTCQIRKPQGGTVDRPCSDHMKYVGTAYLLPPGSGTPASTPTPTSTVTATLPMRMQWTLELRRRASNSTDPVAMMMPRWTGTLLVDPSGRVTGTGRLSVLATQFCREKIDVVRFTGSQQVTVTGRIDPARPITRDPSLQLNLVFGAASVSGRSRPVCAPSMNRYLIPLRRFLVLRPVRAALHGQQYGGYDRLDLTVNGRQLSLDGYRVN